MNLRSLLPHRQVELPLLPVSEPENFYTRRVPGRTRADLEEKLERLLTPTELDIVQHRRPGLS